MAVYLFDTDLNGNDGIRHLIENGRITNIPCETFDKFDRAAHALLTKVTPNDFVIIDTLNSLASTTRGDARIGTDADMLLWDKREQILRDDYGSTYEMAHLLIMRRLKNLMRRGAHIITTLHEADRKEDGTGLQQRAPSLNTAFYIGLIGACSDILRLTALTEPITDNEGNIKLPLGTRMLQLNMSGEAVIKKQVRRDLIDKIPKYLVNPTWDKLTKTLGKVPSWLVIYGPPGVGKTTLVTDMCETHTNPKEVTK